MKKWMFIQLLVLATLAFTVSAEEQENKLMRFADVHGDNIVFSYEADLWLVPAQGGAARRLTSHEGGEMFAKFSPDGSKIAFTASYDGGGDIYVMDVNGGAPKRLTYHPAGDMMLEWFPDGEWILFRSTGRTYPFRAYDLWKVNVNGGMPVKMPVDRGGLATISPDGKSMAYNRIAREFATWKRYKGGMAMNIWLARLDDGSFEKLIANAGNDNWPMWIGDALYFASDLDPVAPDKPTTANIFKYAFTDKSTTQMTVHTGYDVKYPSRGGPDDDLIVYQNAGELYLLDVTSGDTRKVPVRIPSDAVSMRDTYYPVGDYMGGFSLSPSGVRMVFDSRGDIYTVPAEKGTARCLTPDSSSSREKNPAWSPDGRWVAFLSDRTGEEELYMVDRKGEGDWVQLTRDSGGYRMQPVWSPDSKFIAFSDKFLQLVLVDVEARITHVVDKGTVDTGWEDWGVQEYSFSPDSRWLTYTKVVGSQLESVFLYSLDQGKVFEVSDGSRNDFSPSFDPDGKYLYFLSDRTFNPIMGDLDQNHVYLNMTRPYVLILKEGEPSPFKPEECDEEVEEAADDAGDEVCNGDCKDCKGDCSKADCAGKKTDEGADSAAEKATCKCDGECKCEKKPDEPSIDTHDFARRIVAAPVPAGNYFRLSAIKGGFLYLSKKDLEFLKYQIVTDATASGLELMKFDIKEQKATSLSPNMGNYHLSADHGKMIYHSGAGYAVVAAGAPVSPGKGKVSLSRVYGHVNKVQEFQQVFGEAWRIERDFFYDKNMHAVDWVAMGQKYRALVPYCGNRSDLNYLIGEMIGEINAGHTYVYGGDSGFRTRTPRPSAALMGVDFDDRDQAAYHRIKAVLPGDNSDAQYRSPLRAPDCTINAGDYLIAVDGREIKRTDNVHAALLGKLGAIVTVTYNSKPTAEGAKTYSFKPVGNDMELRYLRWVKQRRAMVDEATGGQVAYVHLPDMGERGLVEFAKVYYSSFYKKGFIIDDRYNGGGFTADMMLDRLERRLWSLTIPREGNILRNPENVYYGPLTLLINQDTGSCGEYFATAFRAKKMGKIIGMRTWGGAVGIEPHQNLVDGGVVTPPQFAPYSPFTNEWQFEGWGVDPDIEVENLPADVLAGKDRQLEKAIEVVLDDMKGFFKDWKELPPPPAYPDKR